MKFLKIIASVIGAILLIAVIGALLLGTLVSANRFKPLITSQVMKKTGRQLTIDGDLSWSFFPHLGIKVGHSVLGNTSDFKQKTFAEFDEATVSVKLLPLLKSDVQSDGMILEGLKLYLIKNSRGKTNWQDLAKSSQQTSSKSNTSEELKKSALALSISAVDIKNANVFFIDEENHQNYNIEKFKFHAKNINLQEAFPVTSEFILSTKRDEKHHVEIKGDIFANLKEETLQFKNFTSTVDDSKITGEVNVVNLMSQPRVTAKVDIDTLTVSNMKITDIQTELNFENNILQVTSATAKFYKGTIKSQVKISLGEVVPNFVIQADASNVQVGPLLNDISDPNQKLKFSGTGNIKVNVISVGADKQTVMKNLNGSSSMSVDNGVIEGIDMGYLIDSAYALAKKQSMSRSDSNKTDFGNMTGTFTIRNGVISNSDLRIDSSRFNTDGKGEIDLPKNQIDYSLQTLVKKASADDKDSLQNLYGLPIPIRIVGSLDKPKTGLDTKVLLEAIAVKQLQKSTEKWGDELKGKLPGDAGKLLNNLLGR
jgi:AsmA protein